MLEPGDDGVRLVSGRLGKWGDRQWIIQSYPDRNPKLISVWFGVAQTGIAGAMPVDRTVNTTKEETMQIQHLARSAAMAAVLLSASAAMGHSCVQSGQTQLLPSG